MNDDGDVMMQNSSQLKEINKALMGNANRVQEMSVGERDSYAHSYTRFHS